MTTAYDRQLQRIEEIRETHIRQIAEAQLKIGTANLAAQEAENLYQEAVEGGKDDALCLDLAARARLAQDRAKATEKALETLKASQAEEITALEAGLPDAARETIAAQRGPILDAVATARAAKAKYLGAIDSMFRTVEVAASVRRQETSRAGTALPTIDAFDRLEFVLDEQIPAIPTMRGF